MDNLKKKIVNELDDDYVGDFTGKIKSMYLKKPNIFKSPIFYAVATPVLVGAVVLAIVLPSINKNNVITDDIKPVSLKSTNEKIAFSMLTTGNYLVNVATSEESVSNLLMQKQQNNIYYEDDEEDIEPYHPGDDDHDGDNHDEEDGPNKPGGPNDDDDHDKPHGPGRPGDDWNKVGIDLNSQIDVVHPYMVTANDMLNNNLNTGATVIFNSEANQYTMTIDSYTFVYTQTPLNSTNPNEEEFIISGYLNVNNIEYGVYGERTIETYENESEENLFLRISLPDQQTILFSQEITSEDGEVEESYSYSFMNNTTLERSVEISFMNEDKRNAVEIEIVEDNTKAEYEVFKNTNENFVADLISRYEIAHNRGNLFIIIDETSFTYNDVESNEQFVKNI